MEPNNIENQIREKLNQREIQPSANAWDRLDAMLSVEEQKPKRNFKWTSIAAIFVGFTLIGIFMMNKENSTEKVNPYHPIVLENETEIISNETTSKTENNFTEVKEMEKVVVRQSIKKSENTSKEINPKNDIMIADLVKKEEVVVENQSEETTAKYINPESLLAEVEKGQKVELTTISKNSPVKVDANALLSTAEKEVNDTFREKVIQSFNKNYQSVKSTLANRNYE